MTYLDESFVSRAKHADVSVQYDGEMYRFTGTTASSGLMAADLAVYRGDQLVGYITPYSKVEHGAVKSGDFGFGLPRLFRSVEEAIAELR